MFGTRSDLLGVCVANRVLVTGGSGYFGSFVCEQLVARGDQVRSFDLVELDIPSRNIETTLGDIRDIHALNQVMRGVEIVHHNVAQVPIAKDRSLFESVNIQGTKNVLEAALRHHVKKVIYVSSSAVYGVPENNPVTESTEPHPMEAYGKSKLLGERICQDYVKQGLDVTIIRPRTILGHGRLGIFQFLFDCIREGANVFTLGSGNNRYQFVQAEDLAEACIKASLRHGSTSYNIGTDRFGTIREALEGLIQAAGSDSKVRSLPFGPTVIAMNVASWCGLSPLGPYHSLMYGREMFFDISKACTELDWRPKWSNLDMFIDSYQWYLANRERISVDGHLRSKHRSPMKAGILNLLKWIP